MDNTKKYLARLVERAKLQQREENFRGDVQLDALRRIRDEVGKDMKKPTYLKKNTEADLAILREVEQLILILEKSSQHEVA